MKFYTNHGEEMIELFGEDAQEHCKQCPYGFIDSDGVSCMLGPELMIIDDDTADSDCECYCI